jgi:hypothetical protein
MATPLRRTASGILAEEQIRLGQQMSAIQARLNATQGHDPSSGDLAAMADAQARADPVYRQLGLVGAPPPLKGENPLDYRSRLASKLQRFSPQWRDADLYAWKGKILANMEDAIYADAQKIAADKTIGDLRNPAKLREVHKVDASGTKITEFHGSPRSWLDAFAAPAVAVKRFVNPKTGAAYPPR